MSDSIHDPAAVIPHHGPRLCAACDERAVWLSVNGTYLCDDHASLLDLDDLQELGAMDG